jgi:tetratricopeptide (TPR) repeat protein
MLFERIRRTQKPVFVFLVIAFGVGFVLLGVGQGAGSIDSLSNIFGGSSSSDPASSLQSTVNKNPTDAAAWKQLAQTYQSQAKNDQAISAWESYLNLRKKDTAGLASAAQLLEQRAYYANANATAYADAAQFAESNSDSTFLSAISATSLATNPVATADASQYQTPESTYSAQASTDTSQAMGYRQTLATLQPKNASNQLGLGYDAANARQYTVSLKALREYLKLAPNSSAATQVKQAIAQLKVLAAQGSSGISTGQ